MLEARGYSAFVIHMPTVKPLDGATLLRPPAKHEAS